MAQEVLDSFGGMAGLLSASAEDLKRIKGLGPAKRTEIVAVLELARRALAEQLQAKPSIETPQQLRDYVRLHLGSKPYEVFAVLFFNVQQELLGHGRAVSRHPHPHQRLPARGGDARLAPPRQQCGTGTQPSQRASYTQPGRHRHDQPPERCLGFN